MTGNESVGFADKDITDDFDPDSYDRKMSKIFGDDFYGEDEAEKPVFPSDEGMYYAKSLRLHVKVHNQKSLSLSMMVHNSIKST